MSASGLWGTILLFSSAVFAADTYVNSAYGPRPYFNYGSPVNDGVNMAKVEEVVKTTRTLHQLLAKLPKEFRSRPVFMFDSRSLHHATPEIPRVILSNLDASFILAFPLDPNAGSAEMLQAYGKNGSYFSLKEISFSGNQVAKVSPANTPRCLECHQSPHRADIDPRANWEPYPRWGGALGQEDKLFTNYEKGPHSEQNRLLVKIDEWKKSNDPFLKLFEWNNVVRVEKGVPQTLGPIALTHKLSYWNFRRAARLIVSSPVYSVYRREIIKCMTTNGSGDAAALSFMPDTIALQLRSFEFPLLSVRFERGIHGCLTRIFAPHGIDTTDWTMVFRYEELLFDQFATPIGSGMEFYSALRDFDNTLPKWTLPLEKPDVPSNLTEERATSLIESTTFEAEKFMSGETLLNRCKHCHTSSISGAPYIDFSKKTLKKRREEIIFRISSGGADRMPPRNHLKDNEVNGLIRYLRSLD